MSSPLAQNALHEADNPADRRPLEADQRPDPQVTYLLGDLPFGDYDSDGCWWIVTKTTGWHSVPGMKTSSQPRPFGDGDYWSATWRKSRLITLSGTCLAPNIGARQAALDRFAAACGDGGRLHELRVTDQLGRVRTAEVRLEGDPDAPLRDDTKFDFQIQLLAPDPRKHGIWQDPIAAVQASGSAGLDFTSAGGLDFTGGANFGTPAGSGTALVANYGTATAAPLFRLKGPMSPPTIADLARGVNVSYGLDIAAGETVWINCDDQPARGYRRRSAWSSVRGNVRTWLGVPTGWPWVDPRSVASYQLRALGGSGSELMTSARSAWL